MITSLPAQKKLFFLGVILDENLSRKPHILNIGIIYKASFCLPSTVLVTIYYSLIYPYLMYCVSVWGSTYQSNLKRIFLLQKKLVRIISKASFDAHNGLLFKDLEILEFHDIFQYHTGKLVFFSPKTCSLTISSLCLC